MNIQKLPVSSINFIYTTEEIMTTTINKKSGKGMINGVVSELTTFFHVQPGHEAAMREAIEMVNQQLQEMGPAVHRKMGLREWRQVLFDNDTRLLLVTSFETDWDPYVDDAIVTFSPETFSAWLKHTVEAGQLDPALVKSIKVDLSQGIANSALLKAVLQAGQAPASAYLDVLSDQTVPQIRKAQGVEQAYEQVLDNPEAIDMLQHPAFKPLLDQAAS
ncbi:MAG TPA: hypothetical protein VFX76_13375 [Roseiflexaceae bacterium]|nr:hypothetical protein [Roseiflexaceae bacterium]